MDTRRIDFEIGMSDALVVKQGDYDLVQFWNFDRKENGTYLFGLTAVDETRLRDWLNAREAARQRGQT